MLGAALLATLSVLSFAVPAAHAATFTVTSNNDVDDSVCGAHCSLREAINAANATAAVADEIAFDFAGAPTVISPGTALPNVTSPVTLNGTTAANCTGTTESIQLDGSPASITTGAAFAGLSLTAGSSGSTICRLNIRGFSSGISIQSSDDNTIETCRIGTSLNGETADVNGGNGVFLLNAADTTIADSLISGNSLDGIDVGGAAGTTTITGSLLGTDDDGEQDLGNGIGGVHAHPSSGTVVVGGTTDAERNVLSGNANYGVQVSAGTVVGNHIGIDNDGQDPIPNGAGVIVNGGTPRIGGTTDDERNIISGNTVVGVNAAGAATVQGNWIGPAADGTEIAAQTTAVSVGADGVTIGGPGSAGNVLASELDGVQVDGVDDTVIQGNLIGLLPDGVTTPFDPNRGIVIDAGSDDTLVGGTAPGAGNTIAGHSSDGIATAGTETVIEGNVIGLDATGAAESNSVGVDVDGDAARIGGTAPGARNVISGNRYLGIDVSTGTTGTLVQGNWIGLGTDGVSARPNEDGGISVSGPAAIGGDAPGAGNVIAHNDRWGVSIAPTVTGAPVRGNTFHDNGAAGPGPGLGIDVDDDGVTANDAGDADTGANRRQNFPVLSAAETDGSATTVGGSIDTTPGRSIRIELFSSSACDGPGHGEGEVLLGATTVTAGTGATAFSATVAATAAGRQLTATATDLTTDDTSELSACFAVAQKAEPPATTTTPPASTPPAVVVPPVVLPSPVPKFPAKLRVLRNGVNDGVLDMLIEVTSRAVAPGAVFSIDYESSGRHTRFTVPITGTQVKVRRRLPSSQPKDTGITTVTYAGNAVIDPDEARLRAADGKSLLTRSSSSLTGGRLSVAGTVTSSARGVVRIRMSYAKADGSTGFLDWNAPIRGGKWSLAQALTGDAARGGQLSIQFTGYEARNLRGEQTAKAVP